MSEPTANERFHQVTEQFHCADCEGLIDRSHVLVRMDRRGLELERIVRAKCEHCNKIFAARFVLRMNGWSLEGNVSELTSAKDRAQFGADLSRRAKTKAA